MHKGYAQNSGYADCGNQYWLFMLPASPVVIYDLDLNAPAGTVFPSTGWVSNSGSTTCWYSTSGYSVGGPDGVSGSATVAGWPPPSSVVGYTDYLGVSYPVYKSSVPEFGFIYKTTTNIWGIFEEFSVPHAGSNTSNYATLGGYVEAMLVKVSNTPLSPALAGTSISFIPISVNVGVGFCYQVVVGQSLYDCVSHSVEIPLKYQFNIASVVSAPPPATCITPNIPPQVMPPVQTNDFGGIGTFAGGEDFTMQFAGCSNLNKIRYKINAQGSVSSLGTWREITTSASSYSVPMHVRYYRLSSAAPGPGSVHAAVTIAIEYQ